MIKIGTGREWGKGSKDFKIYMSIIQGFAHLDNYHRELSMLSAILKSKTKRNTLPEKNFSPQRKQKIDTKKKQ